MSRFPRQDVADLPNPKSPAASRLTTIGRHWLRRVGYGIAPLRRTFEPAAADNAAALWDNLMSQTSAATYLGRTIIVDANNAAIAMLIRYRAPENPPILDVGCCGGTLLGALDSYSRYLGTDISHVAIDTARSDADLAAHVSTGRARFEVADLRAYKPDRTWDVIVFGEVLYYLRTDEVVAQVERYASSLSRFGVLIVTMKDDAKSRVIFRLLSRHYQWIDGMLWQRKPSAPDYRIRISRECPSFLVAVFQ